MKQVLVTLGILIMGLSATAQIKQPQGLNKGDRAPLFSAKDQGGNMVELSSLLKKGPVVLVFYRGQWCRYCNKQLSQLEDSFSLITDKGATLVAISPERTENIAITLEKTHASYPVLHDEGLVIMKQYDVAFAVDDATDKKLQAYGVDLRKANGTNGANLPVPAVYIINSDGKITYRHFEQDYTKRASVKEILEQL